MKTIVEYVRQHQGGAPPDKHHRVADAYERACQHHREAARLYAKGEHQQATIHADIAREHAHTARALEALIN